MNYCQNRKLLITSAENANKIDKKYQRIEENKQKNVKNQRKHTKVGKNKSKNSLQEVF